MKGFMVVSYDIPDDRRRARLHKTLKDFGTRVQFSVFECLLTEAQSSELRRRIEAIIDPNEDHVRFYFLCRPCVRRIVPIGGKVTRDPRSHIV
ncbi:MAG: CRISPR-associated endonuclease Cas2 [Deltaproteobacteria bacterium]|nr:MAG: CRISPR-associated endonuclease Cas2 [Deltaproteobacteria bacterium]